ncbi:MAG TPA: glutaconate CoA-transferase [Candidatus Atribacteria bacterium]|nr:glutaconate CoA-transferase [Candidatus Atribacteria bacterium]
MTFSTDFNTNELMAVVVSRYIKNDDVVFIGVGIPLLAGILAVATHAPDATIVYEGGGIGARTKRLPWTISDNPTTDNALAAQQMWRVFGDQQRGFISLGIIGGAEIDPFGNLNTTVILDENHNYSRPKIRLPGSGGANDIASSAGRTVIMIRLQKNKFQKKLHYITSPGHLSGNGSRKKAGLVGGGPIAVVTDKCVFAFDENTKEMYLKLVYPGYTADDIRNLVNWDLKISSSLEEVTIPTEKEIQILRSYDPMGFVLAEKTIIENNDFNDFYCRVKRGYENIVINND